MAALLLRTILSNRHLPRAFTRSRARPGFGHSNCLAVNHLGCRNADVEARAWSLSGSRRLSRATRRKERDQQCSGEKQNRTVTKADCDSEGRPERTHNDTGNEIADPIDCREDTECHPMMTALDQFRAKRIFQRFFRRNINPAKDKHESEYPDGSGQEDDE